jgi:hypothetical protein
MTPSERNYLFVQSPIGSAIVNAIINGAIGWAATAPFVEFPIWKAPGAAVDLVATAFGVAFGTCLGAVIQIRIDTAKGKIAFPEDLSPGLGAVVALMPRKLLPRAVAFGIVAAVILGPPAILYLALSPWQSSGAPVPAIPRMTFIEIKALYSAVVGAIVTPLILLSTLANAPAPKRQPG